MTRDGGEFGWTVGDLRRAIEGVPDSLPINVNLMLTDTYGSTEGAGFLPFRIDSGGISMSDIGTEAEPEPYSFLELNLEEPEEGALLWVPFPPM